MQPRPRITLLAEVPDALPVLAQWFTDAWEPYYGAVGPGDAAADLAACCQRDRLPLALVALDPAGTVMGTAALKTESIDTHPHLSPWLAALLVIRDHRGQGVGSALATAIAQEAKRLGFRALFSGTSSDATLLRRLGWQAVEDISYHHGPITIYRRDLDYFSSAQ